MDVTDNNYAGLWWKKKPDWAERNTSYRVKRKSGKRNVTAKACARRETVIIRNMMPSKL